MSEHPRVPTDSAAPARIVVVLGTHCSGSSCLSMVLHKLGVPMFRGRVYGFHNRNGGGGEASKLAKILEKCYPFPTIEPRTPPATLVNELVWYLKNHQFGTQAYNNPEAAGYPIFGIKYPSLALCLPQLQEAVKIRKLEPLYVHSYRRLSKCIDSLQERRDGFKNASLADRKKIQVVIDDNLCEFLSDHAHVTINYDLLCQHPEAVLDKMCPAIWIKPSPEQCAEAIAHVRPELNHHPVTRNV